MQTHDLTGGTPIDDGRDRGAVPVGVDDVGSPTPIPVHDGLLPADELRGLRFRWQELQAHFTDDPRACVEVADALVTEVLGAVAEEFAAERERLETTWHGGEDLTAADVRAALVRYRRFFERFLAG